MKTVLVSAPLNRWLFGWLLLSVVLVSSGCTNETESAWAFRAEVLELSEVPQKEIRDLLGSVHGSFSDPRMRIISDEEIEDDESDESADEEDAEADEDEEAQPSIVYKDLVKPTKLKQGRDVFMKYCVSCHGVTGDGAGPAAEYLYPLPRDYRPGVFKFTSTGDGVKPRRQDIELVIKRGAKGTSMPAFRWLSKEDMSALVDYVMVLSRRGQLELALLRVASEFEPEDFEDEEVLEEFRELAGEEITQIHDEWEVAKDELVLPAVPNPPVTEETILAGQELFFDKQQGCYKCHGPEGRGGIESKDSTTDAWGQPIIAANLTTGMYHGGARPIDLYRRIYAGISSRMPGFGSVYEDNPEQIWHLVHFVKAFGNGRKIDVPEYAYDDLKHAQGESTNEEAEVDSDSEDGDSEDADADDE